jgi:hypothetical protein
MAFSPPTPDYGRSWIWYNFTVTVYQPNLTWKMFEFKITPGPLTRGSANWTLTIQDAASSPVASFEPAFGNWTSLSPALAATGETIVLETDSSLTMGDFSVACPSLGPGSYSVELS